MILEVVEVVVLFTEIVSINTYKLNKQLVEKCFCTIDKNFVPKTSGSWSSIQISDQTIIQSSMDFKSFNSNY